MAPGSSAVLGSHDEPMTWTALAALTACSPRTTPNGSLRGNTGREGASDSVLKRQGGGASSVLGQGYGGPSVVQRRASLLVVVQYIDKLLMYSCDAVAGSLHGALLCATLGSTVNTCIASASWGCWKNFHIFCVMVYSDPEVDSRPALLFVSVNAGWRGAHSRCFGCFPCWFT